MTTTQQQHFRRVQTLCGHLFPSSSSISSSSSFSSSSSSSPSPLVSTLRTSDLLLAACPVTSSTTSAHGAKVPTMACLKKQLEKEGVHVVGEITCPLALQTFASWHAAVANGMQGNSDNMLELLEDMLAEEVVFLAPTYHKERKDKMFIKYALLGVTKAFHQFRYTRVFLGDDSIALEFECLVGRAEEFTSSPSSPSSPSSSSAERTAVDKAKWAKQSFLRGIDLLTLDPITKKITRFEVMARPPKTVLKLLSLQTEFLRELGIIPPLAPK